MSADEPRGFIPLDRYVGLGVGKTVYLVEPLLPRGGMGVLFAKEKVGKSALAIQLMHALAGGAKSWLGFPVRQHGRVLYLQVDTPRSTWVQRFQVLQECGWKFNPDCVRNADSVSIGHPALDLMNPEHEKEMRGMVMDVVNDPLPEGADYPPEPLVVFFDTTRRIHLGDENSSSDQQMLLNVVQRIADPAAVVLIAHQRKDQHGGDTDIRAAVRGSGAVGGAVDIILWMKASKKAASLAWHGRDLEEGKKKLKKEVLYPPGDVDGTRGVLTWELDEAEEGVEEPDAELLRLVEDQGLGTKAAIVKAMMEVGGKGRSTCWKQLRGFLEKHEALVRVSRPDLFEEGG